MSYSFNHTSPFKGTEGGLYSSSGLDSVAQLRWSASEQPTYVDVYLSIWVYCERYGYKTPSSLATSLSCSGQTTHSTSGGSCDLSPGDAARLSPAPTGSATYYTYRFYKSTVTQNFTISFSVTASGSAVKGTSKGTVTLQLGPLQSYQITYNLNGGTGTAIASQTKYYGRSIVLSNGSNWQKTNCTLIGWNTSSTTKETSDYALSATYTTNSALSLYANWKVNYVKPIISGANAYRVNSSGTADPNGTFIKVEFNYTGGHLATTSTATAPQYEIKINNSTPSGGTPNGTMSAGTGSFNSNNVFSTYRTDASHTVVIRLFDGNDSSGVSTTLTVGLAVTPIDLLVSGNNTFMGLMTTASTSHLLQVPSLYSKGEINTGGNIVTSGTISMNGYTIPKITLTTSVPTASQGNNGDIWLVYTP